MGRPARTEAIQAERRRRRDDTVDRTHQAKLAIPAEFRDDKTHSYRWINDVNDRVHDLTVRDDWDVCRLSRPGVTAEDEVRRVVDRRDGHPVYAYLVRKPIEYYEADKRRNADAVATRERALIAAPATDTPQAASTMYVGSGSSVKRGTYAP